MDPEALLDYALFQLTPTRTRCDLVVVCGGKSEKLASGLLEPFVSHMKFAKDQIPKGGYSITLRPPKTDASWFTKATFLRFVRFVSTPEVLERFARLEKEILQIESSVQPNESVNGHGTGQAEEGSLSAANGITKQSASSKLKGETDGNDDAAQQENSKIRLQRVLETRKALLRKEQAMAYARALAAGFELDNIEDLLVFADTFGASRLREACTDFKELCKKKLSDGLWMDELAAMEAYSQPDLSFSGASGIILACESTPLGQNNMLNFQNGNLMSSGSLDMSSDSNTGQSNLDSSKDNNVHASDSKVQIQMPWPNQIPQYMFNFQNAGQQMPPYQPYPFPPMQNAPPYYPGNMHWPQNADESRRGPTSESDHHRHKRSSSRKKEKSQNVEGAGFSEEDEQTESADSDPGTDSEAIAYKKKDNKKSSKTVVIRNINYITSKRRNGVKDGDSDDSSSVDDGLSVDGDFLKQKVEDVVGTFEKSHNLTSSKKKRGGKRSSTSVNGSGDQEVENDPVNNMSEGGNGNGNWDSFQNLLMREKEVESQKPVDVLDEHFSVKRSVDGFMSNANTLSVDFDSEKIQPRTAFGMDSFIVNERNEVNGGRVDFEDFASGETLRPTMKRRDIAEEALLFPNRLEETRGNVVGTLPYTGNGSSIIKNGRGEDWFIVNHSGDVESKGVVMEQTSFDGSTYNALSSGGDRSNTEASKKILPVDDSFMIQTQTSMDDRNDSHWKTDISLVSGLIVAENGTPDSSQKKSGVSHEPDDLSVVLSRDSGFESAGVSWSHEMDYGVEASFKETVKQPLVVETNDPVEEKSSTNGRRTSSDKQTRPKGLQASLSKSKSDVLSRSKKPLSTNRPMIQKSKLEKEEEARKKMEELAIQRQKRIAERTAASGLTPAASKKVPVASPKHRPQPTIPKFGGPNSAKNQLVPGQIKLRG
ncbi:hypothetical protein Vadar_020771 [Vaccinium darrowii]|uniref:Uncharacterized protein n=1 Tax=Vaccinium darrowii TaxID=229202 RepID=A0ACB7XBE6_9ERIC|nr:hypothetical protein Vadar_020771 [Vaccinium darrowii]